MFTRDLHGSRDGVGFAAAFPDLLRHGPCVHAQRRLERGFQACALGVGLMWKITSPASMVCLAGQQHQGKARRTTQRVAALEQAQKCLGAELQTLVNVAVLGCHHGSELGAVAWYAQALRNGARHGYAPRLMPEVPGKHSGIRGGLAQVMHQARPARRKVRTKLCGGLHHQHLVLAAIHFRVVVGALRHTPQRINLRKDARQCAAFAQDLEKAPRISLHQCSRQFLPYPFRDQGVHFAGCHHVAHQLQGLRRHSEIAKPCGKASQAQNAHRILSKSRANVAQDFGVQIALTAMGIDDVPLRVLRHGIDCEIAPAQIVIQRDTRTGLHRKTPVARCRLALGSRQGILLMCEWVQEYREVAPNGSEAHLLHLLRRRAHHHPIAVMHRPPQ